MSMTRQEQLDAVVRNYGEWPKQPSLKFSVWSDRESEVCFFTQSCISRLDIPAFTRAEVEQRKSELQNKPDPSKLPDEANFYAQNKNGSWDWFSDKATPNNLDECWDHEGLGGFTRRKGEVIGDWRDTLEKRPEEKIESTVENWESGKLGQSEEHVQVVSIDLGDIEKPTPEEEEAFNMLEARNGECIGGDKLLPPVGWKGKVDHGDFGICDCEVIALHDGKAVCDTEHGYYGASSSCFENATSKDRENWIQQAYQVMLKAYQNKGMMPDDFLSDENTVIYLGELYDAGLAKLPE